MNTLAILAELAPFTPLVSSETGTCLHCGCRPAGAIPGVIGRLEADHAKTCPWVAARKALGDALPASREQAFALLRDHLPAVESSYAAWPPQQKALLQWLLQNNLAKLIDNRYQATAEGLAWLARPVGLRAVVKEREQDSTAVVAIAGQLVRTTVREHAKMALPGTEVLAKPLGQQSWAVAPI